jgi:hypothetical protein
MYSTCTFCHAPLGRNEALEHFPVGRKLAFDQSKGRLWVVCEACRLWNLSPLEVRWEAIEEAEKRYRDTRLRVATDQIGLARLRDGTELIRIGEPLRPEFAAWRYGDRFGARWRRAMLWTGAGVAALAGWSVFGIGAVGASFVGGWQLPRFVSGIANDLYYGRLVVGRFVDEKGPLYVNAAYAELSMLVTVADDPRGWGIQVSAVRASHPAGRFAPGPSLFGDQRVILTGANADEATRSFLPRINSAGGRRKTVQEAVRVLEEMPTVDAIARKLAAPTKGEGSWRLKGVNAQPAEYRLALEMAAHEDAERRALEGELAALEAQWKDAEEIAAIADDLTMPQRIVQRLEQLRSR